MVMLRFVMAAVDVAVYHTLAHENAAAPAQQAANIAAPAEDLKRSEYMSDLGDIVLPRECNPEGSCAGRCSCFFALHKGNADMNRDPCCCSVGNMASGTTRAGRPGFARPGVARQGFYMCVHVCMYTRK